MWGAILNGVLQAGEALLGAHSASEANRTNIKNAREQRAWEADMSNTAVQRRADDIEKAGGNRALAFTGGQSASTPSVQAPTVEPTFKDTGRVAQGMLLNAQIKNMNANTAAQLADAQKKQVDARVALASEKPRTEYEVNHHVEAYEWDNLKTKILRNTDTSSAAQARRESETVDAMITMAKQQAQTGKLNLDALENIAKVGGIEAGRMQSVIKMIIDLLKD